MNTLSYSATLLVMTGIVTAGCDKRPANTTPANTPASTPASTPTPPRSDAQTTTPAVDNTARNRGDTTAGAKTPMDQSESATAIKTTADIRRAIMNDSAMSTNAQNCKIITDKNGLVTLRGPVSSQAEKDSIEAKAKAIAGDTRVDNQLEVKVK